MVADIFATDLLIRAPLGLLPVLLFLAALLAMDSFKLVRLQRVLWVIAAGGVSAGLCYFINGWLMANSGLALGAYSQTLAPVVEELLKAAVVVWLFRTHRIGFLVDAAIMGFAVGAGFALVENLFYLYAAGDAQVGVWVVRGFGTALMHGGVTAMFGVITQALTERQVHAHPLRWLPGLGMAMFLHWLFNLFVLPPLQETVLILVVLPPLFQLVFNRSATHISNWLEIDFDDDAELMAQINSGEFSDGKIGQYLHDLRSRFDGMVVVDLLCYLRLYTELALRAKGVLMMREHGIFEPVGERTREKFTELDYLAKSIGKTGLLAIRPFLHMDRKDLWQINVLEGEAKKGG